MSNNNEEVDSTCGESVSVESSVSSLVTPEEVALLRNLGETGEAILAIFRRIEKTL